MNSNRTKNKIFRTMKHYNHISFLLLLVSFLSVAVLSPCMAMSPQKAKAKVVAKRPVSKTVKKRPASSLSPAQALMRKAQSGDAEAQFKLGCCYAQGKLNLPEDGDKKIMWWKKAVDQNHAEACYYLMFALKDKDELLFYARKGTSVNVPICCLTLGLIYTTKEEYKHLAGAVLLKAVELGQTPSTYPFFELAWAYQNGEYGLPKDKSKALFWHKKECDRTYSAYLELGGKHYDYVLTDQKYIKENFNCDYDPALHVDEYKRWLKERTLPSDGGSAPRSSVASSVSSGTVKYHYTKSGRGQSQNTGQWSGWSYGSGNSVSGGSVNNSLEERKRDVLNSGGGYNCGLCKGTGKCFNCKGTGVANYMGTTKKCVSCKDAPGVCPQCHGTKVSPWNR